MASVIRGSDDFDSQYGAVVKAWVNFNGTGTVAIHASLNVSSITDNAAGDYTVNFTNALPAIHYAVAGAWGTSLDDGSHGYLVTYSAATSLTTSCRIRFRNAANNAFLDGSDVSVVFFR